MIYTVTFNPAIDYVVHFDRLQVGEINRNVSEEFQFGGKGINVSNVLRTLGFDTVALGFVAGFIGEGFEKGLAEMGLSNDLVPAKEIGMKTIWIKQGPGKYWKVTKENEIPDREVSCLFDLLEFLYSKTKRISGVASNTKKLTK